MLRFLLISVLLFGFAGWSLYDGLIAYPKERLRSEAFYSKEMKALGDDERAKKWQEIAAENNWKRSMPKKPDDIAGDIWMQHAMAIISVLVGGFLLVKYLRSRGTWVAADEQGLKSSSGHSVEYAKITQIDKSKWDRKGIAKISYEGGGTKPFVLDDFKFTRTEVDQIMAHVETKVDNSLITGGRTEIELAAFAKEKKERAAAEAAAKEAEG